MIVVLRKVYESFSEINQAWDKKTKLKANWSQE
jgi:hypothetical protein